MPGSRGEQDRQPDGELAPQSQARTVGIDRPPVHLDELLHEGKPDAQPALRAVERAIRLREEVEDVGEHLGGDPDARVPDTEDHLITFLPDGDRDPTPFVGVFGGVVEQVHHHLFQAGRVGMQPDRSRGHRHREVMPAAVDQGAGRPHREFDDAPRVQAMGFEPDPARGDPGDFQEVIHEACELSHLTLDDVPGLLLDRVFSALEAKEVHGVEDGGEGVAELVGEHRQELVLAAVEVGQ
jgi:hypothetical protein